MDHHEAGSSTRSSPTSSVQDPSRVEDEVSRLEALLEVLRAEVSSSDDEEDEARGRGERPHGGGEQPLPFTYSAEPRPVHTPPSRVSRPQPAAAAAPPPGLSTPRDTPERGAGRGASPRQRVANVYTQAAARARRGAHEPEPEPEPEPLGTGGDDLTNTLQCARCPSVSLRATV